MRSYLKTSLIYLKLAVRGIFFRPGWYSGNYDMLERMYLQFHDPWNFENSPYEKDRMNLLEEVVRRYPHNSILEVGCAEGVFTERLRRFCPNLTAIDVSATAIDRARARCPKVKFIQVGIEKFTSDSVFDLVICAETLYYVKDVGLALDNISALGRHSVVSYLSRESKHLDSVLARLPLLEFKTFSKRYGFVKYSMNVGAWKNEIATVNTIEQEVIT